MRRVLLSWSTGKDSAWTLHLLRQMADVDVGGLVTTMNTGESRVASHRTPRSWLLAQADAAGLPVWEVGIPESCPNDAYEAAMREALRAASARGFTHVAFGDLHLSDIRAYREGLVAGTGLAALFPSWCDASETPRLARRMIAEGVRAFLSCVDKRQLDGEFVGREFDDALIDALPAQVDPCAERGEFHTFCTDGPMFRDPVRAAAGHRTDDGRFAHVEVVARG